MAIAQQAAMPATPDARTTRFRDVCGSMDELKRLVCEAPAAVAARPDTPCDLIADALFMLRGMEGRLAEYEHFRGQVTAIAREFQEVGGSRGAEAVAEAPLLETLLRQGRPLHEPERAEALERAENIRGVAQDLENTLLRYKELALALEQAYREVKGDRMWVLDESEATETAALPGQPEWARWLPPSPHRERMLRWFTSGRAHLVPPAEVPGGTSGGTSGGADAAGAAGCTEPRPPLVQFQDGGVMPLPDVRWSEEIRSFYAAGTPPNPRGRLYRGREQKGQS
ncbi:MAG: hypothetical protein HY332_22400 [Chloroflexi bacterium]|nr:hypothetical protein [Chloroflexota bacterium]